MDIGGVIFPHYTWAQEKFKPKYLREDDKAFRELTTNASDNGWLHFRRDIAPIDPDTYFDKFARNIGMGEGYRMQLVQDETDFKEIRHQKYLLYYKNVPVEGVEYSLHSKAKRLEVAHGRMVENLNLDLSRPMPENRALDLALANLKLNADNLGTKDRFPKGQLVIARVQGEELNQNYKLCYAFDIRPQSSKDFVAEPYRVYVDATSGEIVRRDPLVHKCFSLTPQVHVHSASTKSSSMTLLKPLVAPKVASTFAPRWNRYLDGQSQLTFETELIGANQYRLSHQNGALITRRDVNQTGNWVSNPDVTNAGTNWGTNVQNATTAHWLAQRMHTFVQQFAPDQNGYNRQGAYPRVLVDLSFGEQVNAFWNRVDQLVFGFAPLGPFNANPDLGRTLVTADVLGHEYAHALTQFNANLEYIGESGALNESISDIFGTAFERYLFPNNWNWDLAEDTYQFRDMANPTRAFPPVQAAQPQIYLGPNWLPVTQSCNQFNDFCGVHINSGVMNKWFHTLCTGQGPNGNNITPTQWE
ncbi:hypothetical protein GCM10023187_06790 [Nibrella viscosa]|uniref:Neutral metalloproteinase n=1 Tax=Nibrella viscosa TaxID=1084524 RepID=A0ABP8JWY6_9BACT